jgi:hypothetical protein
MDEVRWMGVVEWSQSFAWFRSEDAAWAYVKARGGGYVSKHTIPARWTKGTA